jgi:CDP-diacylglycerol---serine O-phosphatidyltransferase
MAASPGSGYISLMRDKSNLPVDSDRLGTRRRRFKGIPIRMLLPNLVTLLALCAGLTAIRFAAEGRFEWAVGFVVAAAALDGIDGRLARMLKGTSKFGAELDSLADFVSFGVTPALILYMWDLHVLKSAGWIAALVFAICAGLRLARFNVMLDDKRPAWAANFFTGMPAPAGAIVVMLPIYLQFLGISWLQFPSLLVFAFTLAIAGLMVSRLPVFSGKKLGTRVPPDKVPLVFVGVVIFFALLGFYPWEVLSIGTVLFLAGLPFGWLSYQDHLKKDVQAGVAPDGTAAAVSTGHGAEASVAPDAPSDRSDERPTRLN